MHAETRPAFAHCAWTAAGSGRLLRLTHAGIAPQQLPTSLTTQSALVLQLWMTPGLFDDADGMPSDGMTSGGKGSLIAGGGLDALGADWTGTV